MNRFLVNVTISYSQEKTTCNNQRQVVMKLHHFSDSRPAFEVLDLLRQQPQVVKGKTLIIVIVIYCTDCRDFCLGM